MNLPGIKKIYPIEAASLPEQIEDKSVAGLEIVINSGLQEIQFFGDATCSVKQDYDNNEQVEEVELKFSTVDKMNTDAPLGFVVVDVNGDPFLIGTKEAPYPVIKLERDTNEPSGSSAIWNVAVKHIGLKAISFCVINT